MTTDWLLVGGDEETPSLLKCTSCSSKRFALIASESFRELGDDKISLPDGWSDNQNNYILCYDCYGGRFGVNDLQNITNHFARSHLGWKKFTKEEADTFEKESEKLKEMEKNIDPTILKAMKSKVNKALLDNSLTEEQRKKLLRQSEEQAKDLSKCTKCNRVFSLFLNRDITGLDYEICYNCLYDEIPFERFSSIKFSNVKERRLVTIPEEFIPDTSAEWIGSGNTKDLKLVRESHEREGHKIHDGLCDICGVKFMHTKDFDDVPVDEESDSRVITELLIASLENIQGSKFVNDFMQKSQLDYEEGKNLGMVRNTAFEIMENNKNDKEKMRYEIQEEVKKLIRDSPRIAKKIKFYSNYTDNQLFKGKVRQEFMDCPTCKGNQDMIVEGDTLEEVKKNTGDHIVKFHPEYNKMLVELGQDIYNLDVQFQPPSADLDEYYNLIGQKLPEEAVEGYKEFLNKVHYMKISNEKKKIEVGKYGMKVIHQYDKHEIDNMDYCAKCDCLWIDGEPRQPSIPVQSRREMSDCQTCIGMFTNVSSSEISGKTTWDSPLLMKWLQHLNDDHIEIYQYIHKHGWTLSFKTSDGKPVQLIMKPPKKPIKIYKNYYQAVSFLKQFNITSRAEYRIFCKSDDCPDDIPQHPDKVYPEFKDWATYLSTKIYDYRQDSRAFTPERLEEFREAFVTSWQMYSLWTDGMITDTLRSIGLFNHKDPKVREMASSFMDMWHDPATKQTLFEHLSKTRFDMQDGHYTFLPIRVDATGNTKYLKRTYTKTVRQKEYGLMYEEVAKSIEEIIQSCRKAVLLIDDSRYIKLVVDFTVKMIWKRIFDPRNTEELIIIQNEEFNGNVIHDKVLAQFQDEYDNVVGLKIGNDYAFHHKPNLMQLYTAYKLKKLNALFNMSRTGTGKTNSAIIASRATYSKFTLIFSPLSIVDQWEEAIKACYKEQSITKGIKIFDDFWSSSRYNYHIMNYDKLSHTKSSTEVISQIKKIVQKGRKYNRKIHFVIIDEAQNVKIRNEDVSARRQNLDIILKELRKLNPKLKVLALSATPVINNVKEGKSLLEMITGEQYKFLKTTMDVESATSLHTEFQPFTIRYIEQYDIERHEHYHDVVSTIPSMFTNEQIRKFHWRDHEEIMVEAKIPKMIEIIKKTEGKVIVYTEFVEGIVDKIEDALEKNNISYGVFTGQDKEGMQMKVSRGGKKEVVNKFVDGDSKVLIASMPIAEGVDGLQYVCNTVIFLGLPWTYARLEQIIGRLIRTGQVKRDVDVHIIKAIYNGFNYDQRMKLDRLSIKKALGNCVVDGTIPNFSDLELKDKERKHFYETIIKNQEKRLKKEFVKH